MTSTPDTLIHGTEESRPRFVLEDWKGVGSQWGRVYKMYISVGLEFPVRQM
jgi:hypothetical protein